MNWRVVLAVLTCSTVLMSASYTMLIPFLPMYLIQELGVQTSEVNWWSSIIFAVSFLISGIFAPIWGAMSDKGSRKLMALRAASCLAITYFLGSIVQTPWQLFGVRVLQGLAAGLWPAQLAILTSVIPHKKIGFSMGLMQAGLTAGGVLGPLVGGFLAEVFGMRSTFQIAAVALTTITIALAVLIKEPPRAKPVQKSADDPVRVTPLRNPVILRMLFGRSCSSNERADGSTRAAALHRGTAGLNGSHRLHFRFGLFNRRHLRRDRLSAMGNARSGMGLPSGPLSFALSERHLRHCASYSSRPHLVYDLALRRWPDLCRHLPGHQRCTDAIV